MGIVGNGSSQHELNWFVDQGKDSLATAWFVSLPIWVYQILMLVWSLWLVVHLPTWLKWGWQAFTQNEVWRSAPQRNPSNRSVQNPPDKGVAESAKSDQDSRQ